MNGIIFCVCSTLWTIQCVLEAIPAKLTTLKPCRRGRYRKQNKEKMSAWLQNRNLREIYSLWSSIGLQQCRVQAQLKAWRILQQTVQLWIHSVQRNLSRWIRTCATHQTLLTQTPARRNLLLDWKDYRWSKFVPSQFGHTARQCRVFGKIFTYIRQKHGRPKEDKMEQVNTNAMNWGLLMAVSLKADVHLGKDHEENLRVT